MVNHCPNCGAPPNLNSYENGACEYCGSIYEMAAKCRSGIEVAASKISCFIDCEPIGKLFEKGIITMNEGRRMIGRYQP